MRTTLVHHAAQCGQTHPPNSLSGLRACLAAGARYIEVDITPLVDGEYALLHDQELSTCTDGHGRAAEFTAAQVRRLHLLAQGQPSTERVACLSDALALVARRPRLAELQLDLKPHASVTSSSLDSLLRSVQALKPRIRVTSPLAWAVRRLRSLDPELALGFDPLRHIDLHPGPGQGEAHYLQRAGAYGYLDDHALAAEHWGTAALYLAERIDVLWALTEAPLWYVRATLIARGWDDGFDWIAALHRRGAQVAAWTLNPDQPHHIELARRLVDRGIDRIISDDPAGLSRAL